MVTTDNEKQRLTVVVRLSRLESQAGAPLTVRRHYFTGRIHSGKPNITVCLSLCPSVCECSSFASLTPASIQYSSYYTGRGQGHVTHFKFLGPMMSLGRLKLEMLNFVHR